MAKRRRFGPIAQLRRDLYPSGKTGEAAASPTTVVQGRTRHAVTIPFLTYGSDCANASAGCAELPEKKKTA